MIGRPSSSPPQANRSDRCSALRDAEARLRSALDGRVAAISGNRPKLWGAQGSGVPTNLAGAVTGTSAEPRSARPPLGGTWRMLSRRLGPARARWSKAACRVVACTGCVAQRTGGVAQSGKLGRLAGRRGCPKRNFSD